MDLRQLRYFAEIVESGSFSKAAGNLRVAQPALSQHVRRMEEELGVALLHRGAQGVVPTEAGRTLYRHARRILAEFAELPDSVGAEAAAPRGEVRFGMPGTVGELLAVPLIEAAKARYPDIRIRVVEAMSGHVLDWLKRGDVDLAMIYSTADPRGLAVHHALSEEICLFASADAPSTALRVVPLPRKRGRISVAAVRGLGSSPAKRGRGTAEGGGGGSSKSPREDVASDFISLREAARLPLVVPGPGHGLRELIEAAALSVQATISPSIEIDSYGQIKKLVARGLGYGILPLTAVGKEAEAGAFRTWRFADPPITRKVYLAYSTERPLLILAYLAEHVLGMPRSY